MFCSEAKRRRKKEVLAALGAAVPTPTMQLAMVLAPPASSPPVATMDSSSVTLLAEVSAMSTRMLAMESHLATQQQTTVDTDVLLRQRVVGGPSGFLREEVLQPIRPEAPLQVVDSGPSPLECLATVALDTGTTDTRAGRPDRASGHRHSSRSARSSSRHTSVSGAARTGHRSPVTGHRASDTGHRAPGTRHRAPGAGYRAARLDQSWSSTCW